MPVDIVIEKQGGSYVAYFRELGKNHPETGCGIARKPHDAVSSLIGNSSGFILLAFGTVSVTIVWADPEEQRRWSNKYLGA
jgi:hypothetical protein